MNRNNRRPLVLHLCIILSLWLAMPGLAFARPERVAGMPFEVHADRDLSSLTSGLGDMLASRLTNGAGVEVVPRADVMQGMAGQPAPADAKAIRELGAKLQADYILTGSLTSLAHSLSLDA